LKNYDLAILNSAKIPHLLPHFLRFLADFFPANDRLF